MIKKMFLNTVFFLFLIFTINNVSAEASKPVPVITGPEFIQADTPYQFDGSMSYDPDGNITKYEWFASGATPLISTSISQTFSWYLTGTKTIFLVVTDNDGETKQTYKTLTITDPKPPMTGIYHTLSSSQIKVGETSTLLIYGYPQGAAFQFFDDGGEGYVDISQNNNTAFLSATRTGYKKIGYLVSHPDHASYRGYIEFMITQEALDTMQNIYWYSPSSQFVIGSEIDIYVMCSPVNSVIGFTNLSSSNSQIVETSGNRCRVRILGPGELNISYTVACTGYHSYTQIASIAISEKSTPTAVITAINSGYTGETYTFSALNSSQGVDGYEWKWHSTANTVLASSTATFQKTWRADQGNTYTLYLRVSSGGIWSSWVSKTITIEQGISFDADTIYSGTHLITEAEWQYIRQKIGTGYEKEYVFNSHTYCLNVEIFQDKGLIVYGDHALDDMTTNLFSPRSEDIPYFDLNGTMGEYKYLGYIYGGNTPFSNQNYKSANMLILEGTEKNADMISFLQLPSNIKSDWGLSDASNEEFFVLKDEINSSDSYELCNNNSSNYPKPLYLKNVFDISNRAFDPFAYGIVNFFDKFLGGSVRLFFRYSDGGYDWRTFEGTLDSQKQCPQIHISDDMIRNYTVKEEDQHITIEGKIYLTVYDNKRANILVNRSVYYYDRDDAYIKDLEISKNSTLSELSVSSFTSTYLDDSFIFSSDVCIEIEKTDLNDGINTLSFLVSGGIEFTNEAKRNDSYVLQIDIINNISNRPIIETLGTKGLTQSSVNLDYRIHELGSPKADMAGVDVYNAAENYSMSIDTVELGDGTVYFDSLSIGTEYKYRAFIVQDGNIFYGEEKTFITPKQQRDPPKKPTVINITTNSAFIYSDPGSYIVCNGEEKLSGSYFYGLLEDTQYDTHAYYRKTESYDRSINSETVLFRTLRSLFELPDRYIYIGETIVIEETDSLELLDENGYVTIDGNSICGFCEGVAALKGIKGNMEAVFYVHVFPIQSKEADKIVKLTIKKIYDPDLLDVTDIDYSHMPVFEHVNSGMIDLGYLVSFEMEFSNNEIPDIPAIRILDKYGVEFIPFVLINNQFQVYEPQFENMSYTDKHLFFDLYLPPHVKFFKSGEIVDEKSVQKIDEVLVCFEVDTQIEFIDDEKIVPIVTKKIQSDLLQVFWYNLRRNCYDDVGYDKGW